MDPASLWSADGVNSPFVSDMMTESEGRMSSGERDELLAQLREVRTRFAAAHRLGLDSLGRGDHRGFGEAIKTERDLAEEQGRLFAQLRLLVRGSAIKIGRE